MGARAERGSFSQLPFERVDAVTGNLTLTFTDLVLPGNAGMDLRVTRTYSHQKDNFKWTFGFAGVPIAVRYPTATPELIMADGSVQNLHSGVDGSYWVTTEFWRYAASSRTLYLPNGWVATYSTGTPYSDWIHLIEVHDVYGNSITPTWTSGTWLLDYVTQTVNDGGATRTRTVDFSYSGGSQQPTSMSYDGRTWSYTYESSSPWRMTNAQPPAGGPDWEFAYGSSSLTVTTPTGGTVAYAFADEDGRAAVDEITTGGREIDSGTWSFDYAPSGNTATTTITTPSPSSRSVVFVHAWHDGPDGKQWTLTSRSLVEGSTTLSSVARTYTDIGFLTSKPLKVVNVQTITQDGVTFTTDFDYSSSNYGDYLQPHTITASASNHSSTQVTTRTFDTFTAAYILPRVAEETITMGSESHTRSIDYDSIGFVVGQTALGVTATSTRDNFGNLASVTDPDSHITTTAFQWGVPATVTTPEYTITRSINEDGSVASETRDGLTTTFAYDDLGRITTVTPDEGDATTTSYASNATSFTVTRGSSWVTTTVDGFGRPISTETVGGIKTTTTIDEEGRTTFQSAPFTGSSGTGNTFAFDALGRITTVTHTDASDVTYAYSGTSVTITDENNHTTTQTFQMFGSPGGGRLTSVVDADSQTWAYSYNALGSLTLVDPPSTAPNRSWSYHGTTNRLTFETQPESGTTSYTYDAAGLVATKTDARGLTSTYQYDANHRLTGIVAPTPTESVIFEYDDSDNQTRMKTGGLESVFGYDDANRLVSRQDRINGKVFSSTFEWDTRDNLKKITYPSSRIVQYDYDSSNRITKVYAGSTTYAEDLAYHPIGAVAAMDFGNGTTETLTLNSRFRPDHLVTGPLDVTYGYDVGGNVSSIDDARSGYDSSFYYDALDRLTSITGYGANTYTYDGQGNRLTKASPSVTYSYSGSTNQLTGASASGGAPEGGTFGYDAAGNMTTFYNASSGVSVVNAYTSRGMMRSSVDGSNPTTRYQYDATGMRAMKSGPTGQSYFIYGPGGMLLAEYAGSFSKESPWAGTTGLSPDVTLEWGAVSSATYELCVDTVDDDACTTSWTSMSSATATTLADLAAATYFWQVRATTTGGTTYADANNWWSFTVNAEGVFGKTGPGAGSTVMTDDVTLTWNALPDVGYSVCWDTSNNATCDTAWYPNGAATSRVLEGLSAGTYYWQVRAWDGTNTTYADADIWWSFVKVTGASGKLSPQTGVSGLSDDLWLSWAAAGDVAYYVCWDTTNNATCDTSWYTNGGSTTRLLQDLSPGTYYWQVKVWDGGSYTEMNSGAWWHFTVGAASGGGPGSGTSSVTREYIYLGGKLIASVESGTTTTYYHTDVLGSVRAITNSSGSTLTRHDYFAFGESTSSLSGDPRRFTGKERDAETAFDYFDARYFRNVWGRFTSADDSIYMDLTNPQTFNLYTYTFNNPLRWVDPSGHDPQDPRSPTEGQGSRDNPFRSCACELDLVALGQKLEGLYGFWMQFQRRNLELLISAMSSYDSLFLVKAFNREVAHDLRLIMNPSSPQEQAIGMEGLASLAALALPNGGSKAVATKVIRRLSPNQMNMVIRRGQAPVGLIRIDIGKVTHEQTHALFKNGAALNIDGTWKHGVSVITRAAADWLRQQGWVIPK